VRPSAAPAHNLASVQRLVAAAPDLVVFRRAFTTEVVADLDDVDPRTARRTILDALCRLVPDDYAQTLTAQSPPADVYGWRDGLGRGWYIKFTVLPDGRLLVISFHPPEAPLRTRAGVVRM